MNFFDQRNPNKYLHIKSLLTPYNIWSSITCPDKLTLKRYGRKDGSYVLLKELTEEKKDLYCLSYGIGNDPFGVSFEQEIIKHVKEVHMFDGSIEKPPIELCDKMFFHPVYLDKQNFKQHILDEKDIILKMDIEGNEYDWLTDENLDIISNQVSQFCVEIHSLIQEVPDGWVLESAIQDAKKNPDKIVEFLRKLNDRFTIVHIHGNNHSPLYGDLPDCLEITYINNSLISKKEKRFESFPIIGMDEPNLDYRQDYTLNWWI
jgi:hypothetical protein